MGSWSSGRWHDHRRRWRVEECRRLALADVRKHCGPPDKAWSSALGWNSSHTGRQTASIGLTCKLLTDCQSLLRLLYRERYGDNPWQDVDDPIDLVAEPAGFGGRRWWMVCPDCERRVAALYLPPSGGRYRCRTCHGLTYASTQEHDARVSWYLNHEEAMLPALMAPLRTGMFTAAYKAELILEERYKREFAKRYEQERRARRAKRRKRQRKVAAARQEDEGHGQHRV
jgi:hypothetical protein